MQRPIPDFSNNRCSLGPPLRRSKLRRPWGRAAKNRFLFGREFRTSNGTRTPSSAIAAAGEILRSCFALIADEGVRVPGADEGVRVPFSLRQPLQSRPQQFLHAHFAAFL